MRFATEQKEIALICQYEIGACKCKGVFTPTSGGVYPFSQSELWNLLFYVLLGDILSLYFCFPSLLSQFEPIFVSFTAILHVSILKSCHLLNFTLTGCLYWWCGLVIFEVDILGDPVAVSRAGEKARPKFSSTGGKAPGYRLSSDDFQMVMVKRMLAPDWVQKMLCIIVPNWRTASPEFFSWVRTLRPIISPHLPGSFTKLS